MFFKHSNFGKVAVLIVYMDGIIINRDYKDEMVKLKGNLASEFELKDFGQMQYFLGTEVTRSRQGIVISQIKYVLDLLAETGMSGWI